MTDITATDIERALLRVELPAGQFFLCDPSFGRDPASPSNPVPTMDQYTGKPLPFQAIAEFTVVLLQGFDPDREAGDVP